MRPPLVPHASGIRSDLPSGIVTFLFTDVEGSTSLLHELGAEAYAAELDEHRRVVREACTREGGVEVDTQGDAFFFAFGSAASALAAAEALTEALSATPIRVRVGVHTGTPLLGEEGYVGSDVHFAARVAAAGHGGQVVLSAATAELVELPLSALGSHRLKDIEEAVSLYQLGNGSFPPLKTIANTNLPTPASSFLGREDELYEADQLLQETRLLTVTGPGGAGKTRFALELGRRAREEGFRDYADGVFSCFLASLRDPALVLPAICQTLSLREQPGTTAFEALAAHLEGRRMLLLLDNLEHLLGCARELSELLQACPGLSLLVTSRELLRVSGEVDFELPPLGEAEGVALFCERARSEPSETIAELCLRLDGLPLAIELAAARTRILTPSQLLERLGSRLDLLKGGRDVDPRQQTLRATIEWSYDLLSPEERQLFAGLSVFAGGCTLEAAEEVCDAELDTLQSLVEKSLLRFSGGRYWMLETIREHAAETLPGEPGESDAVVDRFLEWMQGVVGEVGEDWTKRGQIEWLTTLETERANFMNAVAMARSLGRLDRVFRLVVAGDAFIDAYGPHDVFVELLDGMHSGDPALDGRALLLRLRLLIRVGRHDEAAIQSEAAAAAMTGDPALEGRLLSLESFNAAYRADYDMALARAREAVARLRTTTDDMGLADALSVLGVAVIIDGDADEGLRHLRESRLLSERVGDAMSASNAGMNEAIGLLAARRPDEASRLIEKDLELIRAHGNRYQLSLALLNLGIARAAAGDSAGARATTREGLEQEMRQFEQGIAAEVPLVLAIAAVHDGEPERAIMLWAAGTESGARSGYVQGPELTVYIADLLEPLRERSDFERLWERGRSLSTSEALELGLRETA